ncbi:MAG: glycosyltransferase [Desulfobacterales bacterium]
MSVTASERPEYLEQCLEGLAAQRPLADEVVLMEDGKLGADLKNVIHQYRQKLNIRSIRLETQNGLAWALNTGLKECSHDLVARIDSDDICLPGRFEKQVARFAADPHLDVLGTFATDIDESGNQVMLGEKPVTSYGKGLVLL